MKVAIVAVLDPAVIDPSLVLVLGPAVNDLDPAVNDHAVIDPDHVVWKVAMITNYI